MPLPSETESLPEINNHGEETEPHLRWQVVRRKETRDRAVRSQTDINMVANPLRGEQPTRLAVLLTFCDRPPEESVQALSLSKKEWEKLLRWLDFSGLALYYLDRLIELNLCGLLPPVVLTRLHTNLIDNAERTRGMIAESITIQREFQKVGLSYVLLKGLSLWPSSVQRPELRSQFDLDFLVDQTGARKARSLLERRGYRLYAVSGRSWEFKLNERPGLSLKDLYRHMHSYAVELHIEACASGRQSLLERVEWRELYGMTMAVLSPIDLLLGQGLHAYKHICGEFSRASHLVEFRRHVLFRRDDEEFWIGLELAAKEDPTAYLGLGVVTLLITRVMGEFAPEALTRWTVDRLPRGARLWVEMYGSRVVLGNYPGSKMHLLLQRELEVAGILRKRSLRQSLLPLRFPPPVIRTFANEPLATRLRRYSMQLQLIFTRMSFHLVEGLRFALESRRWRQMKVRAL